MRASGGEWILADLADPGSRARMAAECLGRALRNGQVLHAGFFLGPRGFYAALREMPDEERAQFGMRGVAYVNQLYGADQELRILQRRDARFVNTTMMVTLLGAAVSDALESGQVVSGVGGQYNFVAMAHALPGARSILCLRATRTHHGHTTSNIVWSYGHETIPRHLRDLVVTEYGVADLRGRTDEEIIAALLNIADSRFQQALLSRARTAGKIRADYRIPDAFRNNLPQRLELALKAHRDDGFFSEYPFGTDLTAEEIELARALQLLDGAQRRRPGTATACGWRPWRAAAPLAAQAAALRRMGLEQPRRCRRAAAAAPGGAARSMRPRGPEQPSHVSLASPTRAARGRARPRRRVAGARFAPLAAERFFAARRRDGLGCAAGAADARLRRVLRPSPAPWLARGLARAAPLHAQAAVAPGAAGAARALLRARLQRGSVPRN